MFSISLIQSTSNRSFSLTTYLSSFHPESKYFNAFYVALEPWLGLGLGLGLAYMYVLNNWQMAKLFEKLLLLRIYFLEKNFK